MKDTDFISRGPRKTRGFEIVASENLHLPGGAKAFQPYNNQCHFYLDENQMKEIYDVITGDPSIQEVNMYRVKFIDLPAVEILAKMIRETDTVRILNLGRNRLGWTEDWFAAVYDALKQNTSVEEVNLSWNGLHQYGPRPNNSKVLCELIAENKTIKVLDIGAMGLRTSQYSMKDALVQNTTLKTFKYESTCESAIDDDAFIDMMDGLAENQSITELDLCNSVYSERGAQIIADHLLSKNARIEILSVGCHEYNEWYPTIILNGILNCKVSRLRELFLGDNEFTDHADDAVDLLSRILEKTDTIQDSAQSAQDTLRDSAQGLRDLSLSGLNLRDEAFAKIFKTDNNLTHLYAAGNQLGTESAKCIAALLRKNKIVELSVPCSIIDNDIFIESVKENTSLIDLYIKEDDAWFITKYHYRPNDDDHDRLKLSRILNDLREKA